jgi:hypothetical protein
MKKMLVNPITSQVLNEWTDGARAVALESRRRKSQQHQSNLKGAYKALQSDIDVAIDAIESEAWDWAIKNRRKFKVSKRKLFQALRAVESAKGLSPGGLYKSSR